MDRSSVNTRVARTLKNYTGEVLWIQPGNSCETAQITHKNLIPAWNCNTLSGDSKQLIRWHPSKGANDNKEEGRLTAMIIALRTGFAGGARLRRVRPLQACHA